MTVKNFSLHKNHNLLFASILILGIASVCLLIIPHIILLSIVFVLVGGAAAYYFTRQQAEIQRLRHQLASHQQNEDEYAHRTEELRGVLHDLRNPMSALKLSIQILQRTSCDEDHRYLDRMEDSLEAALEQVNIISNINKSGQAHPPVESVSLEEINFDDCETCSSRA